ncbi:carboxylesterase [Catenovulum agarivorans DS-2]|uniref:Carboxylic ester hydrolase n=1 Tax=Catenovulum agarivorans DS-2 TaxID=1328313 RepID=W7R197_9ALTE|nr:carboxylesterase family protein [Catenovulum agarivorans]EWH11395.1 carboxylesterase [Catenovulum agarivorans DS-2]
MKINKIIFLICTLAISVCAKAQAHASANIVKLNQGQYQGVELEQGVVGYLGVPFAKPPVGELRWKLPQPIELSASKKEVIHQANQFAARCVQNRIFNDIIFRSNKHSEDCLYLNIWSKADNKNAPVYVYFHGGGFAVGSGDEARYDGEAFAKQGIVFVSVNYRLGVFGFLSHPELSKETNYKGSGNYGLYDQQAAIQWVKNNIKQFGGNPEHIVLGGESAGSISVSAQMLTSLNKNLLKGVTAQSGSMLGLDFSSRSLAEGEDEGVALQHAIAATSVDAMRKLSAEQLLKKATEKRFVWFKPVIDGKFFTDDPHKLYAQGKYNQVPLLTGVNTQESSYKAVLGQVADKKKLTQADWHAAIEKLYPDNADKVKVLYPASTPEQILEMAQQLASDRYLSMSTWLWADAVSQRQPKQVYYYLYARPRPSPSTDRGAAHAAEIEYALGNLRYNKVYDWQAADYKTSEQMQKYFIQFIKTLNPNRVDIPNWPLFKQDKRMVLDNELSVEDIGYLRERYKVLQKL